MFKVWKNQRKLIEITYQIYSKENDISFEKYVDEVVMNDDKKEIFDKLWEEAMNKPK